MPAITFTNQKGGVGKTTSAVSVAAELAAAGHPTLLIDADPQGNASSGLGILDRNQPGTYDILVENRPLDEVTKPTTVNGLDVIPASKHLAGTEAELAGAEGRYVRLARALTGHHYRYVIIDAPPSLGFLSLNTLVAARHVVIPVQGEYYALEGLSALFEVLRKVKKSLNPEMELLGVLITMYDKRLRLSEQVRAEVAKHFPEELFDTVIPRNVRLAEAPSHGQPISQIDRWSKGARAYKKLSQEVHERIETRTRTRA